MPWSITCGIYGLGVHTSFHDSRAEADAAFEAIKRRLEAIAAAPDQDTAVSHFRDLAHDF